MSSNDSKLINFIGVKTLYNDIRDRLENLSAANADVAAIISKYDIIEEDDEGMVITSIFKEKTTDSWDDTENNIHYEYLTITHTVNSSLAAVEEAFAAGKHVILSLNEVTESSNATPVILVMPKMLCSLTNLQYYYGENENNTFFKLTFFAPDLKIPNSTVTIQNAGEPYDQSLDVNNNTFDVNVVVSIGTPIDNGVN